MYWKSETRKVKSETGVFWRLTFHVSLKEAIKTAISLAKAEDIILVAGKGHEKYQEIKGVRNHFDDKEVVREMFEMLGR